jgi:hypothetical protein
MKIAALIFSLTLAACASSPRQSPSPDPPSWPSAPTPADPNAPLNISLNPSEGRYTVESRTVVFAQEDTLTPVDSVTVNATMLLTATRDSNSALRLQGTVERLAVSSGLGTEIETLALDAPFSMTWSFSSDGVAALNTDPRTECDQLRETARDLMLAFFPPVPRSAAPGEVWNSVTRTTSCRAGLDLELSTTTELSPMDLQTARTSRELIISAAGKQMMTGTGKQGASNVTLRGAGETRTVYMFDLTRSVLREAETHSLMLIEFDLGYRTDRLVQRTVRTVVRGS